MSMLIGEKIKKIRLERKISQEKLANHLYVSRQTISRWETGKVIPNMDNILQLSTFFDEPVSFFIGEEKAEPEVEAMQSTTDASEEKDYAKYGYALIYFAMSIVPFVYIWSIPFAVYAYYYADKKHIFGAKIIKLLAIASCIYFIIQFLVLIVGLFNLTPGTTEVFVG
ncbi:hypothetical protein AWM74_04885 [Aerococcus urinaeequi]|uniref:HTH cro/C1-type domain-containing protein n=2 Tax=Aerococcus urinaeequi TaxID=51665 RepID=A0AAC8X0R0_9LACT|nr:hypothetical protein AWM74_04885 [Aerococcus urinaeequi]